jgi:hypothetical protein
VTRRGLFRKENKTKQNQKISLVRSGPAKFFEKQNKIQQGDMAKWNSNQKGKTKNWKFEIWSFFWFEILLEGKRISSGRRADRLIYY